MPYSCPTKGFGDITPYTSQTDDSNSGPVQFQLAFCTNQQFITGKPVQPQDIPHK
jgi:hypothetical protein